MIKRISLVLVFSALAGSAMAGTERASYQNPSSAEETTGFISGAALGGLVGGPPGIIFGAVIGAIVGDGWHARKQVGDLQANLYASEIEIAAIREEAQFLQREYQIAQQQLDRLKTRQAQIIPATLTISTTACCDDTALSLHFRTGSSVIEHHYEEQLLKLASVAKEFPTASIEIVGYADRNGDANLNLKLSRDRSNSVKQFFNRIGIRNSSMQTVAYGETKPLQSSQSFETDFFDRRVIVRLRDNNAQMLTQTPDGE